ncbi:MAG: mechanosensitive ion channel [Thermomicrobiales bacterium]|nr:mechanosensitive ion channel [Thermomicrobiales bacterium]
MPFISDSLNRIGDRLSSLIGPNFWDFVISVLLIVAIYFASRIVRSRVREYAKDRFGIDNSFPALLDNIVRVLLFVLMATMVFSAFGVDSASLVTFLGFATAAIALSLQDVLRNIFCGIYLLAEQPFQTGDRIRLLTEEGWVERIDLRVTRIRNDRQELVLIPNQTVFNQVVSNRSTRRSRPFTVELTGIKSSIDDAESKARAVIDAVTDGDSDPTIRLKQSGPDGVNLEITCRRTASENHQERIARALVDAFPDATLTVLAR